MRCICAIDLGPLSRFLENMKLSGLQPDLITMNSLIRSAELADDWQQALSALHEAEEAQLHPDVAPREVKKPFSEAFRMLKRRFPGRKALLGMAFGCFWHGFHRFSSCFPHFESVDVAAEPLLRSPLAARCGPVGNADSGSGPFSCSTMPGGSSLSLRNIILMIYPLMHII